MRVTNGMMISRYERNLAMNKARMSHSSDQISTGRRFMRGSEDPVRALKALQTRRRLDALEQFHFNIEMAETWLADTERACMAIKASIDRAFDLVLQGRNDTLSADDRMIIATALRSIQAQVLHDLNTQLSGKFIFGNANTKQPPFVVCDASGHLWFNVAANVIEHARDQDTGLLDLRDALHGVDGWNVFMMGLDDHEHFNESNVYWDLTGQFHMDEFQDFVINPTALFNVRTTGLDIIGTGPNNVFNLIGRIAMAFEMEDMASIDGPHYPQRIVDDWRSGPDGLFWVFEDYLISRWPDRTDPNPEFGIRFNLDPNDPNFNEYTVIPEVPGWRPYLSSTMSDRYTEDYLMAFGRMTNIDGGPDDRQFTMGLGQRLQAAQQRALLEITRIGEQSNFVEFLKHRNEDNTYQMQVMQITLETIPPEEAIMWFKMHDFIYKATLQMSSIIFQPGLMSFLHR